MQIIPKGFSSKATLAKAESLLRAKKVKDAITLYEQVLTFEPENSQALFYMGQIALAQKDASKALRLAERAVRKDKTRPELWYLLGEANSAAKDFGNAAAAYERAFALQPDTPGLALAFGIALARSGQPAPAAKIFQKALDQGTSPAAVNHNLGNVLVRLKRYDEAITAFRNAAARDPDNPLILYGLGRALIWAGAFEESLAHLTRALEMKPAYLQIVSYKILALRHLGRHDDADALEGLDDMVIPVHLDCPAEFASVKDFNVALRNEITGHPALTKEFAGRATRNGAKVDHMFAANKTPLFEIFEREVRKAFDVAIAQMPRRAGLPIPFEIEGGYRADMWANVMYRGGHQVPHNHPAGWFSASYYNTLPDRVTASGDAHEGWIEFGGTAYDFPAAPDMPTRQIQPEEGMMVVFPSYIFHRTIPFESDEIRLSCAFDAKPLKWGR